MLSRIRDEQFQAMKADYDRRFEDRLVAFLHEQFPESQDEPQFKLRDALQHVVAKARQYGLETEQHIAAYLVSAWALGVDFDTDFPAAQKVLSSPATPHNKCEWLEQWAMLLFEVLEEESY